MNNRMGSDRYLELCIVDNWYIQCLCTSHGVVSANKWMDRWMAEVLNFMGNEMYLLGKNFPWKSLFKSGLHLKSEVEQWNLILCSVDRASLYDLFQMEPTRCTLLLSLFISTSLHVSGNYVPIIGRTYCIYATLVFFTVYGWLSGLLVGMGLLTSHLGWVPSQAADQTAIHTEWKIPVLHRYSKSSWRWPGSCPKHVQKLK